MQMQRMQMRMNLPLKQNTPYALRFAEIYSDPCQSSEEELFAKTVNDLKTLKTIVGRRSIFGVWEGSGHASNFANWYIWKGLEVCVWEREGGDSRSRSVA